MKGIAYRSIALEPFDEEAVALLAEQSAFKNANLEITGYLYFDSSKFFQYLEGPVDKVNALYHWIACDPRHKITHQVEITENTKPLFPHWHMCYLKKPCFGKNIQKSENEILKIFQAADDQCLDKRQFEQALHDLHYQIRHLEVA